MQTRLVLSHPFCAAAMAATLAVVWFGSASAPESSATRQAVHEPLSFRLETPQSGVRIQRVDFVLDTPASSSADEAQKKRKTEQRRAPAAKPKQNAKAASEPAAAPESPPPAAVKAAPAVTVAPPTSVNSSPAGTVSQPPAAALNPPPAIVNQASEAAPHTTPESNSRPSRAAVNGTTPASMVNAETSSSAAQKPGVAPNPLPAVAGRAARLTRDELLALLPGSTMLRTNKSGALRQWVNKPDGTLTVFWGGGGIRNHSHSASGHWSVTNEGRFCLQIDWDDLPENWCRFLEPTASGEYQPIADMADANWSPPTDKSNWRPLTIRH